MTQLQHYTLARLQTPNESLIASYKPVEAKRLSHLNTVQTNRKKKPLVPTNAKELNIRIITLPILDSIITTSSNRYTFVHFWATWCGPCRKEFPELLKDIQNLKSTTILFVSMDYDSEAQRQKVKDYYLSINATWPLYMTDSRNSSDITNSSAQVALIKHYGCITGGGLPYNVLIENKTKKTIVSAAEYKNVISAVH